tara:strand:- start:303 stop:1067 length:765 start_codon:yes stop_codon:yes gene_type:complete
MFDDYSAVLPLPYKRPFGLTTFRQPIFIRTIPVAGNLSKEDLKFLFLLLKDQSSILHMNLNLKQGLSSMDKGQYQVIEFEGNIESQRSKYSNNVKRILKKDIDGFEYSESKDVKGFISFFKEHVGSKYKALSSSAYDRFNAFMIESFDREIGSIKIASIGKEAICKTFIIDFGETRYYIKGAATEEGRKSGAMTHLLDQLITEAHGKGLKKFDFVGSNNENLMSFNKKFGAINRTYDILKCNNLLWPLSKLIKP